jgi:hypothetical protein
MWIPGSLQEGDDLRGHWRGNMPGEPYLHAKRDDCGARDFSQFWRWNAGLPTLGNDSVGATPPLLHEACPIKHLGDNQIMLNRIMLMEQVVGGAPQWESAGAADVDSIIESGMFIFETNILFLDRNSFIY